MRTLEGKVVVITGAAGLLGYEHVWACANAGAAAIVGVDIREPDTEKDWPDRCKFILANVTFNETPGRVLDFCLKNYGRLDALINNAANNPKVEDGDFVSSMFESFPRGKWDADLEVGLTGAFLMSRTLGTYMAHSGEGGSILNISSVHGILAPDQRLYARGKPKPVSYVVEKHALIGLTRYIATYWADRHVTCNALCPAGVYNNQPESFVEKLADKIPVGRMARRDEYRAAVVFALTQEYMTGSSLVVDGGLSSW